MNVSHEIRYRFGEADKNSILRLALLEAWGHRCYWCTEPKDFADIQIDHIIPHTITTDDLEEILREHLPWPARQAFDVHTAQNLAPICTPCNIKKGNTTLIGTGILSTHLRKSSQMRTKVERYVRSFQASNTVSKALLAVSTADLTDPGSRKALDDLGPIVMQRFAMLTPEVLTQYSTIHKIDDPREDESIRALVNINETGRKTKAILEEYYKINANDAFLEILKAVKSGIIVRLEDDISSELRRHGHMYPQVGPPAGRRIIEIEDLAFDAADAIFTAEGTFEFDVSAEVVVPSENDSGSESFQSDTAAHGRFSVAFWPDKSNTAVTEVDTPLITEWNKGPAPW